MLKWSALLKRGAVVASAKGREPKLNERQIMKRTMISGLMVMSLVLGGMTLSSFAGNGPGNGKGYGCAPKSEEERAARQAACAEANGGVCPNGGPRTECPGLGQGQGQGKGNCNGQGQGKGQRRGACDGTGPRAGTTNCPANSATQK
jgi:hypothetical protein